MCSCLVSQCFSQLSVDEVAVVVAVAAGEADAQSQPRFPSRVRLIFAQVDPKAMAAVSVSVAAGEADAQSQPRFPSRVLLIFAQVESTALLLDSQPKTLRCAPVVPFKYQM